jgi:Recombinase
MRVARKAQAAQFAANVLPIIRDIQAAGHTSFNAIAGQLNARKVATANGGQWRHVQVRQILERAAVGARSPAKKCFNGTHPAEADIRYSHTAC